VLCKFVFAVDLEALSFFAYAAETATHWSFVTHYRVKLTLVSAWG